MLRNKLIGYAESYLSFLFSDDELWHKEAVKQIVLFGSAARNEATADSDIDLFVEVYRSADKILVEQQTTRALSSFLQSQVYKEWMLRGIRNEIKLMVGVLGKQSDLKRSLISDGLVLFGKFSGEIVAEHTVLFSFETIQEKNKRYRVDRRLFGRREKGFEQSGLVEQLGGRRISNRVFVLPSKQTPAILAFLKAEKVDFAMHEIWSDTL